MKMPRWRGWIKTLVVLGLVLSVAGLWATLAMAQTSIILDGMGDDWDPAWQVATDPLDVTVTGTGNHPHEAPTYARSGYDATALWAHYDVSAATWYFRLDVDGRIADSDSQTGTPGNLGVGTHAVDQGPLGGDSTGIGTPEAYRLRFQYQDGGPVSVAELAGDSTIVPGVLAATTAGLTGQGVYSTTFNPGILEWAFARNVIIPVGSNHQELWLGAQMGDNSDQVSDDDVSAILLVALDLGAGCPQGPIVVGEQATFPLDYAVPAAAAQGPHDVVLTANVPAGTAFISASNGGTESGGVITWHLGDLNVGDAGQVTFTLRVNDVMSSLTINSQMTSAEGLQDQATNECPVQTPAPTLELVTSCPQDPIVVGSQATFPLDYGVAGSSITGATNMVLTAQVPAGTTFISAIGGGTESGGVITWHLGDLDPGDGGQVTFTLRVTSAMSSLTINSEMTCAEQGRAQSASQCPVQQAPTGATEVPEPSTILLLGGGLAGLGGLLGLARARARR
ncbi:MAG: DUF11 domain-containing protein [Chloroflexi bacterium]|nr:DUF11 domain-containing protein [Chloroflexota bacterium]MBU1749201.1 DUF11 domain-containing protein [Chloroflexota bacterium]MBU1880069.1 DUF11 domain-containing protein [Chloroflexota bacterium]